MIWVLYAYYSKKVEKEEYSSFMVEEFQGLEVERLRSLEEVIKG